MSEIKETFSVTQTRAEFDKCNNKLLETAMAKGKYKAKPYGRYTESYVVVDRKYFGIENLHTLNDEVYNQVTSVGPKEELENWLRWGQEL